MLKNFRKIFTKIKTKDILENNLSHCEDEIHKNIGINDTEPFINEEDEDIKLDDVKETATRNIVRTRLNAYVIKNKEEDFRLMDYDMDTGEVVWIEGKLFNNLRGLQRVRWSPSSGSATVYYGYISVEDSGDKLVSSVYIMNIIKDKLNVKEIISTKINNRKIEFLCLGENKVKIFKELYPNKKINNFYTDSMNDLPLMKLSNNVYLVKGNKIEKITK